MLRQMRLSSAERQREVCLFFVRVIIVPENLLKQLIKHIMHEKSLKYLRLLCFHVFLCLESLLVVCNGAMWEFNPININSDNML